MVEEEPLPDNPFKRKAEEDRRRKKAEAEARAAEAEAKAKAKKAAKKKANAAPEDDWFQDGPKGGEGAAAADSDDDDMGFRMFSKDDLDTAPIDKAAAKAAFKPMKVKMLIDFSECDVPEEKETLPPAPADAGGGAPSSMPAADLRSGPAAFGAPSLAVPMGGGTGNSPRPSLSHASTADQTFFDNRAQQDANYMAEIEHLQQMLRDANEEKMISVAIIQDDVEDKKQIIADLKGKQAESDVELQIARDRIKELEVQQVPAPAHDDESHAFPDHWGAMGKSITDATVVEPARSDSAAALALATALEDAEIQKEALRAEVARLQGELERKIQALQEKDALQAEVEKLRAAAPREVPGGASGQEVLQAEVDKLQAEAQAQKEVLLCAERARVEAGVEAERCRKEAEDTKRAANEQAVALSAEKASPPAVSNQLPPSAAAVLLEVHDLCDRARQSLGGGLEGTAQQASNNADVDAKMRCLRDAVAALQVFAEEAAAERKRLVTKTEDLERANAGAVSKPLQSVLDPAPPFSPAALAAATNGTAGSPLLNDDEALRAEAQAAAEVLGKHAAQALREVRLNAERQLAWISKRINMKVDRAPGAHGAGTSPVPQADAGT